MPGQRHEAGRRQGGQTPEAQEVIILPEEVGPFKQLIHEGTFRIIGETEGGQRRILQEQARRISRIFLGQTAEAGVLIIQPVVETNATPPAGGGTGEGTPTDDVQAAAETPAPAAAAEAAARHETPAATAAAAEAVGGRPMVELAEVQRLLQEQEARFEARFAEQNERIGRLEADVARLTQENTQLTTRNQELEQENARMRAILARIANGETIAAEEIRGAAGEAGAQPADQPTAQERARQIDNIMNSFHPGQEVRVRVGDAFETWTIAELTEENDQRVARLQRDGAEPMTVPLRQLAEWQLEAGAAPVEPAVPPIEPAPAGAGDAVVVGVAPEAPPTGWRRVPAWIRRMRNGTMVFLGNAQTRGVEAPPEEPPVGTTVVAAPGEPVPLTAVAAPVPVETQTVVVERRGGRAGAVLGALALAGVVAYGLLDYFVFDKRGMASPTRNGLNWYWIPPKGHVPDGQHLEFFNGARGNHAFAVDLPKGAHMVGEPGNYKIVGPNGGTWAEKVGWKSNGVVDKSTWQQLADHMKRVPHAVKRGQLWFNDQDGGPGPRGWVKHYANSLRLK